MKLMTVCKVGAATVVLSLGAGCGGSDELSATDGGTAHDGANASDAMGSTDGASSIDGGSATDGGRAADAGLPVDGGNPSKLAVNLGSAVHYVIFSKSGISDVPTSAITGNIAVSPAHATYITGFPLTADSTTQFSTTPEVTGKVYASDYGAPTPSNLTTAVGDMQTAFTDAAGRAPGVTELGAGNIGGMTLSPNVYKWSSGLLIPTNVTLNGSATDVWIFQIAQDLTVSNAARIALTGGALPKNVFWQVAGSVALGTTSHFEGVILTQTAIALHTGASINGRLFAQTAVTLDRSTVIEP